MQRAAHRWGAILIAPGPKSIVRALQEARAAIQNGDVVGLFPEGGISRSGVMQTFKPGLMRIIDGVDAPVIPMYLDGLWGASSAFTSTSSSGKSPSVGAIRLISTLGNPYTRPRSAYDSPGRAIAGRKSSAGTFRARDRSAAGCHSSLQETQNSNPKSPTLRAPS